jgi:molybdate transport system substrate-binding protein
MKLSPIIAGLLLATSVSGAQAAEPTTVSALFVTAVTASMAEIIPLYERSHPNVRIQPIYGGPVVLAAQVASGTNVDLIMIPQITLMPLRAQGKVGVPVAIYSFRMAVLVPKGSTKVRSLRDLANPGVRVALGTDTSTIGKYAHEIFEKASAQFGADFGRKVMANVIITRTSEEPLVAVIKSRDADAAIGFTSDVSDTIDEVAIPAEDEVYTTNEAAVVSGAPNAAAAQAFIDYLRGAEAQAILRKHHIDPPR